MAKYVVEKWDIKTRKYYHLHIGHDEERARIMARKPYNTFHKGKIRIKKIITEIIYESKSDAT